MLRVFLLSALNGGVARAARTLKVEGATLVVVDGDGTVSHRCTTGPCEADSMDIEGSIPTEIGDCAAVTELRFAGNSLTGTLPTEVGRLASLTHLQLQQNWLTGPLPSELGQTSLDYIWLWLNSFTGTLPSELGLLTNMTHLVVPCYFTGTVPTELGELTKLWWLWLAGNELTGTIPTELGALALVEYLYLEDNDFTGPVPTELGGLAQVVHLSMEGNSLTGTIPSELGALTSLKTLRLHSNDLTGRVPSELGTGREGTFTGAESLDYLTLLDNKLTPATSPTKSATPYWGPSACTAKWKTIPDCAGIVACPRTTRARRRWLRRPTLPRSSRRSSRPL
jgi:Leucine-rich repeat (LRR) protein